MLCRVHPADAIELLRTTKADPSRARTLQRGAADGHFVRVRHGVYVPAAAWAALDGRSRYLVRMRAAVPLLPIGAVFTRDSAAAVLGVPRLTSWPEHVHVTVPALDADRRRVGLTLHAGRRPAEAGRFHGVPVASLAETVIETSRRSSLSGAVVAVDHALRSGVQRRELEGLLESGPDWGRVRVANALGVADERHESVGESFFAARCHELRAPYMEPQVQFVRPGGKTYRVDFWMPSLGLVLEFDGRQKYRDHGAVPGTADDVLWSEKLREDDIRADGDVRGFIRVTWWHLVDPERLRTLFRMHGVPCR
ncbi:hypothetical protein DEJ32_05045 [Curtobacterium sp. MCPF17_046]|nr:hypothetical protein DEJ32_05045 [Curtobacterium sp. MCPF17_046]